MLPSFAKAIEAVEEASIAEVILSRRGYLDQTFVEVASFLEGESELSRLNQLFEDFDLVLLLPILELSVYIGQTLLALPSQYLVDLLQGFSEVVISSVS